MRSPCCETNHPAGSEIYDDAYDSCMCGAQGKCQAECAKSSCSDDDNAPDSVDGDACNLCEERNSNDEGTGACDAPIKAACAGNANCVAFDKCQNACP